MEASVSGRGKGSAMAVRQVGLVDETGSVPAAQLDALATALQTQVERDLGPAWGVSASIAVGAGSGGTWRVRIVGPDQMPGGAGGVHLDDNGLPYAMVGAGPQLSVAASHETCEMLVDPFGQRLIVAPSLDPAAGGRAVQFLAEVCDPCEVIGYGVGAVTVSDFVLQDYYQPQATGQVDQAGRLAGPFDVPRGGYISWYDPADSSWHQKRPDGSIVTAAHPSALSTHPRRDRDKAFAGTGKHDLARLLPRYRSTAA
jgi:hypothetical protein